MSSQPTTPPFLTFVNYLEAELDSPGVIHLPEDIFQPIFDASEPLNAAGLDSLIKKFGSNQIINCYRLEADTFNELVKVVLRLPASSKKEKTMGIYMNCFQSWSQIRKSSTHVPRLKAHGLSVATVDKQQVEGSKMLAGWMIDILARNRKANHSSYTIALFISTLCYHQSDTVGVLADRLTTCGHQFGTTILTDTDPIRRILAANIVRDVLYRYSDRWVYWPTNASEGVIDKFPIAERADHTWLQSLWAFFDAVDLGKGFNENDARPRAFPLSEVDIPGIDTGGPNNFIICSFSAEVVSFILPASSQKAVRYLEVPLVGLTNVKISDEESDNSSPSFQIVLRYLNNRGTCLENGFKRALSRFTMTPIGDVFILHDAVKAHLSKTALETENISEPPPLQSETEMGDTQPLDETNISNSAAQVQHVRSDLPIENSPSSPFAMLESKQEVVQVRDSQPEHSTVDTINPLDILPMPIADTPKPPPIDAGQFSAADYLGASNVIDELAGQPSEDAGENPGASHFEEPTNHKTAGSTLLRSGNVSDEVAEDSYPLTAAERIEPVTTTSSNFHIAMTKTLDMYTLAEPAHRHLDVSPRSLQTPKKRGTRKANIGNSHSTKRMKQLAGSDLSGLDNLTQEHTEGVQAARSEQEIGAEAVNNKSGPKSNIHTREQASETPVSLPKKLTTKQPRGKKTKKPESGAKITKLPKSNSPSRARMTALQQESRKGPPTQQGVDLSNAMFSGISKKGPKDEVNDQCSTSNVQTDDTHLRMNPVTGFKNHQSAKPSSRLSRELAPTDLSDNEEAGYDEADQAQNETFQRPSTPVQHNTQRHPPQISVKKHRRRVATASMPQQQTMASSGPRRRPRTPSINDEDLDSGKVKIVHFGMASIGKSSITSAASRRSRRLQLGYQAPTETGKKRSADAGPLNDRTENTSPSLRLSQRSNQDSQQPVVDGDDGGISTVEDFGSDDSPSPAVSKFDPALTNRQVLAKDAVEANAKVSPQRPRHQSDEQDALASTTPTFADPGRPTKSPAPGPTSPKAIRNNFVVEITTKASVTPKPSEQHSTPRPIDSDANPIQDQPEVPVLVHAIVPNNHKEDIGQSVKSLPNGQPVPKSKPPETVEPQSSRVVDLLTRSVVQQGDAKVLPGAAQSDFRASVEAGRVVDPPRNPQSTVQWLTIQQPSVQVEISPKRPNLPPTKGRKTVSEESTANKAADAQSTPQLHLTQRPTPAGITVASAKAIQESCGPEKPEVVASIAQAPGLEAQKRLEMARPTPKETCNSTRASAKEQITIPRPKKITDPASGGAQSQASPTSPEKTQQHTTQTSVPSAHVAKAHPRLDAPRNAIPASQHGKIAINEACGEQSLQPTRKIVRIDPPTPPQRSPPAPVSSVSTFFTDFHKDNATPSKPGETNNDRHGFTYDFDEGDTTLIDTQDTPADTHSNTNSPHASSGDTHSEAEADVDIAKGNHLAQLGRAPGRGKYHDVLDAFNSVTGQIVNRLEAAEEVFSIQGNVLDAGIKFTMKELLKCQEKDYKKQKDDLRPRIQKLGELYAGIGDRVEKDYSNGDPPVPPSRATAKELLGDLDELEKRLY